MNTEKCNTGSINMVTHVASICNDAGMVRFADIEKALEQQTAADLKRLKANYAEQNKLRPSVLRFRDLESEAKVREERIQRIVALTGDETFEDLRKKLLSGSDVSRGIPLTVDDELPLWMAMRAIVEQVTEIQVIELQHALEYFDRKTSRQAIESALASHKETFEAKTRNRDKFVSLKR
jgi:hypothetical protein